MAAKTAVGPTNNLVTPLLTDFYQCTMAYAYWKADMHKNEAVFDVFFRKSPFKGEFAIFCGLEEVLRFLETYKFSEDDVDFLRKQLPQAEPEFFEWIAQVDCSEIKVHAMLEGSVVFPRTPLLRIEGPVAVCQLIETPILNLTNYATLVATNAARMRRAAGASKTLLEFGLRRAQGPDGAISASRYSFVGGFDGTSNCAAGKIFNIEIKGTHAHSYVCSFHGPDDLKSRELGGRDLWELALAYRTKLGWTSTHAGELAAFVSYAIAFPDGFLALVDTYDTIQSGVRNFLCVSAALMELGHQPVGIRLDSGDLSYLSKKARDLFLETGEKLNLELGSLKIVASNDINEGVLLSLAEQGHEIDSFGIGTNLVTCQAQPALGMVYKLVEIKKRPAIKLSNEFAKVTIPGKKDVYRIIGAEGVALCDVMVRHDEQPPQAGKRVLCRHPFVERKRVYVTPTTVLPLLQPVWDGPGGSVRAPAPSLNDIRGYVEAQLQFIREDHLRALNPAPFKVSVSDQLYTFIHQLWMREVPIVELS